VNWRELNIHRWALWIRDQVLGDPTLPLNPGIMENATKIWDAIQAEHYKTFQSARKQFEGRHNPQFPASFKGECMGVGLEMRSDADPHITVVLLIEDDTNWFEKMSFSSHWLPEMQRMIAAARAYMKKEAIKDGEYGYKFKIGLSKKRKKK
jgi:hypothetical protein